MKYVLREKPEFSITLGDDNFTIVDSHRKGQSSTYIYEALKNVEFREKQMNIFAILLDLVFGGAGSVKKDPWLFKIITGSKHIQFYPEENNVTRTRRIAALLKNKISNKK